MTPVLEAWKNGPKQDFPNYAAGTWGPDASDAMLLARRPPLAQTVGF